MKKLRSSSRMKSRTRHQRENLERDEEEEKLMIVKELMCHGLNRTEFN